MSELAWPIAIMLFLVFAEALVLQAGGRQRIDWHDVVFNLNSGHLMLWLFRGLEITCYGYVAGHFSLDLFAAWPPAAVWLLTLILWDLGFYWLHRLHHRWPLLWAVHQIHHQGRHFNLSLGVRNSWYSSLTSIPFFMLLAVAGVPLAVFAGVSVLHYSIQFYNHNGLAPRIRWLERFLVTPALHRVHHVNAPRYCNSNYGGTFSCWDRLFGSLEAELPAPPFTYGVGRDKPSENPFWASNRPFCKHFGIPLGESAPRTRRRCGRFAICSGAILLFGLVIAYVDRYGYGYDAVSAAQITWFLLLASGAVALGGLSEGRAWALPGWLGITLSIPLCHFGGLREFAAPWTGLMLLLALHGAVLALVAGRKPVAPGA